MIPTILKVHGSFSSAKIAFDNYHSCTDERNEKSKLEMSIFDYDIGAKVIFGAINKKSDVWKYAGMKFVKIDGLENVESEGAVKYMKTMRMA